MRLDGPSDAWLLRGPDEPQFGGRRGRKVLEQVEWTITRPIPLVLFGEGYECEAYVEIDVEVDLDEGMPICATQADGAEIELTAAECEDVAIHAAELAADDDGYEERDS